MIVFVIVSVSVIRHTLPLTIDKPRETVRAVFEGPPVRETRRDEFGEPRPNGFTIDCDVQAGEEVERHFARCSGQAASLGPSPKRGSYDAVGAHRTLYSKPRVLTR